MEACEQRFLGEPMGSAGMQQDGVELLQSTVLQPTAYCW